MHFKRQLGEQWGLVESDITDDVMTITHTYVPPEFRGMGIAEDLTREALAWVKANKKKVVPQCSYTAAFFRQHPEFSDLLAAGT